MSLFIIRTRGRLLAQMEQNLNTEGTWTTHLQKNMRRETHANVCPLTVSWWRGEVVFTQGFDRTRDFINTSPICKEIKEMSVISMNDHAKTGLMQLPEHVHGVLYQIQILHRAKDNV
jgi:hypothetical protein